MKIKESIEIFLEQHLEGSEHFLVEIEQKGTERFPKIVVFLDGDKGISINDCSKVSKAINNFIEKTELITTEYSLDVSSPGIDKPLIKHRQYVANIGRIVKLVPKDDIASEGKLVAVTDNEITLEIIKNKSTTTSTIEIAKINQIKVLITF